MTDSLSISIAQLDPTVGDIAGNLGRLMDAWREAKHADADLVVASELFVAGYPPEDLVLKPAFIAACQAAVAEFAQATKDGPAVLLGTPWRQDGKLYNAAALIEGGKVAALRFKHDLPNYGVFDEKRVFAAGPAPGPVVLKGVRLGLMVCEDMWSVDACECLQESGAELLIVINGSPFEAMKHQQRLDLARDRVKETGLPLLYVNQVGGQDELVFDGASFALAADGELRVQAPEWKNALMPTRWRRDGNGWTVEKGIVTERGDRLSSIYQAMVLGLSDYVRKNKFPGVVLGLSGGIDSALSAAVAVDALGADRVHCVMMPSPYTSKESLEDAAAVAEFLECELREINIGPAMEAYRAMLAPSFEGREADITEENIQSRARGVTLMALSNKFGWMVLSTGNKSEMSAGYATLYGDMCGGYSVLKDVYKVTVFELSRWRNTRHLPGMHGPMGPVMPERVITKPPSAELKHNQTDQDTLPPYEVLDDILQCLIEHEMPVEAIVARGHPEETVRMVWRMLDRAEYKRRQAPPGVKITSRAFGRDRRYPITNAFQASGTVPREVAEPGETPRAPAPSPANGGGA
ncbi:MAG TPA: NAD+ synthase [Stellaceae bacterium]|nr:NAD+ synthase [Stellaceae bacterium]